MSIETAHEPPLKYHLTVDGMSIALNGIAPTDFAKVLHSTLSTTIIGEIRLTADSEDRIACLKGLSEK